MACRNDVSLPTSRATRTVPDGRRARRLPAAGATACVLILTIALAPPAPARDKIAIGNVRDADALATSPSSKARDQSLGRWAAGAPLADVLYVLRHGTGELAGAEKLMLAELLKRVPESRPALRACLGQRYLSVGGRGAFGAAFNPRASVFRVAALLPDTGSFVDYANALHQGLALGLEGGGPSGLPIALERVPSRTESPRRMLAAFDSAAARAGAVVGELLSPPTAMLATAARYARVPLLSATAPDERIGEIGPMVFQIGPSAHDRAIALAARVLGDSAKRVGILVPADLEASPWVNAFAAEVVRAGSELAWRSSYAPGDLNFRDEVRDLIGRRLDILFWEGDPREAEALLLQLGRDKVSLAVCGGDGLDPSHHHDRSRVMLEGAVFVSEEWRAEPALAARLDSLASDGAREAAFDPLRLRGYLAGRALARAVAGGALCPEEMTAALGSRTLAQPRGAGFLDVRGDGVALPVYRVRNGQAAEIQ